MQTLCPPLHAHLKGGEPEGWVLKGWDIFRLRNKKEIAFHPTPGWRFAHVPDRGRCKPAKFIFPSCIPSILKNARATEKLRGFLLPYPMAPTYVQPLYHVLGLIENKVQA